MSSSCRGSVSATRCAATAPRSSTGLGATLSQFVASGKTNYATHAVQITTIVHMMCPAVWKVWDHWRTASMTGRKGRNAAWDYVLEMMNLSFKTYLSSHVTEARLLKFGVMINAVKHTHKTFELAWRRIERDFQDEEGGEYSRVEQADVGA